jgi:hypothetical protein
MASSSASMSIRAKREIGEFMRGRLPLFPVNAG